MKALGPSRVSLPLLALLWLSPLSGLAAGVEGEARAFDRHLNRAEHLYDALEYEKSLQALNQARQAASTDDEKVMVALYRGIVLADLGRRKQALEEFRAGLTLQPKAVLPLEVAPKVKRDFESVRKQVLAKAASSEPAKPQEVSQAPEAAAPVAVTPAAPAAVAGEAPKSQAADLRSRLGAAGSAVGERVGSAVGSALDVVVGPNRKKKDTPPPAEPEPTAKDGAR